MNAAIDTPAFAGRFAGTGLGHGRASVLAAAPGESGGAGRQDVTPRDLLRPGRAEWKPDRRCDPATVRSDLSHASDLVHRIARFGGDANGRRWSIVTIVSGVATATSASVAAGVALLLKSGGL